MPIRINTKPCLAHYDCDRDLHRNLILSLEVEILENDTRDPPIGEVCQKQRTTRFHHEYLHGINSSAFLFRIRLGR